MLLTFVLVIIGWIIFRAETIGQAWEYFTGIFTHPFFPVVPRFPKKALFFSGILILTEWLTRKRPYALEKMTGRPFVDWTVYYLLVIAVLFFSGVGATFIYFQF